MRRSPTAISAGKTSPSRSSHSRSKSAMGRSRNVADAAQAVPDSVRNAPAPQQRVVATQLAPGVVLLGGGSHNSVAVEFKDFVTVIEGPLNNQRTNAVVAEVKKTFPNKPIRYLVNQPVPPARMQRSQRSMVAARPRAVWLRQPQHRPMLPPPFSPRRAAFATHDTRATFLIWLAASVGAGISRGPEECYCGPGTPGCAR
jgi:hypothetical protein